MTWLELASHVADVGSAGVPYIGEGPWVASQHSSRTSRRSPGWSSNFWTRLALRVAGRPTTARGAYRTRHPRPARHWPAWSALKGRHWRNPRTREVREQ